MSILTDFGIDWHLLLVSIVNFAVLAVILQSVMIKPLVKLLEDRETTIRSSLERAELERAEAKLQETKLADERAAAAAQARQIVTDATTKAAAIVARAATEAEAKAATIVATAQQQSVRERDELLADATSRLGSLVADATQLVIGTTVTLELDRELVRAAIASATKER